MRSPRLLPWAMLLSLALHGGVLFLVRPATPPGKQPPVRLEASLGRREAPRPVAAPPLVAAAPAKPATPPRPPVRRLAVEKDKGGAAGMPRPRWSAAERTEMNRFMDELAGQARDRPSLAQRSLAMADDLGRRQARQEGQGSVSLEPMPDAPPLDAFSLEMYLDGMLKKLNRSAAFVRNDPRSRGVRTATVQIRLNPNGSLRSFEILNAGDQEAEIAFIRSVVERAVPFSPFPEDMRRSARSLAMVICILPTASGDGGFGFTRNPDGRGC